MADEDTGLASLIDLTPLSGRCNTAVCADLSHKRVRNFGGPNIVDLFAGEPRFVMLSQAVRSTKSRDFVLLASSAAKWRSRGRFVSRISSASLRSL